MWNKNRLSVVLFAALAAGTILLSGCGGGQKEQVKETTSDVPEFEVEKVNEQLAQYPVQNFDYKGTNPTNADWDNIAKKFLPYVKNVVSNMPEGYVLEVRGHTDSSGPETATANKKGNLYWSEQRAKNVKEALIRQGMSKEKLTHRGVGSSENISDPNAECLSPNNCRSKINRRVTFHVVQK